MARNLHLYQVQSTLKHTHTHARADSQLQHMSRMILFARSVMSIPNTSFLCIQDTELDYECVLVIEGQTVVVDAYVETDDMNPFDFDITCQLHQV